jgi:hypothetical protein
MQRGAMLKSMGGTYDTYSHILMGRVLCGYLEKHCGIRLERKSFVLGNVLPDYVPSFLLKPQFREKQCQAHTKDAAPIRKAQTGRTKKDVAPARHTLPFLLGLPLLCAQRGVHGQHSRAHAVRKTVARVLYGASEGNRRLPVHTAAVYG